MVTEFRQIVFSTHDLTAAITEFYLQKRSDVHGGSINNIRIARESPSAIKLTLEIASDDNTETVTIETAFVAAAMLKYCFKLGIPVSRGAQKNIEMVGDNLALNLSINARKTSVDIQ